MPRGVSIKESGLLERFKNAVQQKLGFSVSLHKNYVHLSEIVYQRTNCNISISTIKRLFSTTNPTKPSKYSLDCIARAVGFASWDEYVVIDLQYSDFEHLEIIENIKVEGYLNAAEFNKLFHHFLDTPHYYSVTLALIEAAIKKNDVEVLAKLFDLPKVWDLFPNNPPGFYFIEKVGMLFREAKVIYSLIPIYAKHPVGQTSFVEMIVDEESLNGYYGELLEVYAQNKQSTEAQLFYHCLMCQRDFENGDMNSPHFHYLIHFRTDEHIHHLPLTRRLALLTIKYIDNVELCDSFIDEMYTLLQRMDENDYNFCIYKYCQIVFMARVCHPIKKVLSFLKLTTDDHSPNHFINRLLNLLKIYQAYVLYSDGKLTEAKRELNNYNRLYCYPNNFVKTKMHFDVVSRLVWK
ncbi:MAG: hypothetical protein NTY32_08260 [Bacteroidia bacterium]|nr:hypothetical protein [Bacteroidia bacterium]